MKQFDYTVVGELGLCAPYAGALVKKARQLDSTITVRKEDKTVSAKNLMEMIRLGIRQNDIINVKIEGSDEEYAADIMQKVLLSCE